MKLKYFIVRIINTIAPFESITCLTSETSFSRVGILKV